MGRTAQSAGNIRTQQRALRDRLRAVPSDASMSLDARVQCPPVGGADPRTSSATAAATKSKAGIPSVAGSHCQFQSAFTRSGHVPAEPELRQQKSTADRRRFRRLPDQFHRSGRQFHVDGANGSNSSTTDAASPVPQEPAQHQVGDAASRVGRQ